jgi:hypothetical protein
VRLQQQQRQQQQQQQMCSLARSCALHN